MSLKVRLARFIDVAAALTFTQLRTAPREVCGVCKTSHRREHVLN